MGALLTSFAALKDSLTGSAFASDPLAAASGDSLSIPNFPDSSRGFIEEILSANSTSKMELATFGNRFGDPVLGLRLQHMFNPTLSGADGVPQLLLPPTVDIPVYRGDTLTVQVLGTASAAVAVVYQAYYEQMEGVDQRLARWSALQGGIGRVLGIEVTVTPGATSNYGTAVALNANDDRLVGTTDYALLGVVTDQPLLSVGIKGPDTGNYRVACPGHWNQRISAGWFVDQDARRTTPHIPVINALNKATTFVDAISPGNPGSTKCSFIFAELTRPFFG